MPVTTIAAIVLAFIVISALCAHRYGRPHP